MIRDLDRTGPWTISDVRARSNANAETIRAFVKRLEVGGVAVRVPNGSQAIAFRLTSSPSALPRFRGDGSAALPSAQAQMWCAMRRLGQFSRIELVIAASTDERAITPATASSYLSRLTRAGYLTVGAGRGRLSVWRLKPGMNSGPEAPRVLTTGAVFDPNRNALFGGTKS